MIYDLNVTVGENKYTVTYDKAGRLVALRYGEPWRDLAGDNLIYFLACELQQARAKIKEFEIPACPRTFGTTQTPVKP